MYIEKTVIGFKKIFYNRPFLLTCIYKLNMAVFFLFQNYQTLINDYYILESINKNKFTCNL